MGGFFRDGNQGQSTVREFRSYAIVPAAGQSRRMKQPKLLLPWNGSTVLQQVLAAWRRSAVDQIFVVARADDVLTHEAAAGPRTTVVRPVSDPPDMKASVLAALQQIESDCHPVDHDAWLLAPADLPFLSSGVIDRLLKTHATADPCILVPHLAGHRGHPVLLPWFLASAVPSLTPQQGIRDLLTRHRWLSVDIEPSFILHPMFGDCNGILTDADATLAEAVWRFRCDLDTPDQYRQAILSQTRERSSRE
jgi:molybdenum cofactor cytidylyltransferase